MKRTLKKLIERIHLWLGLISGFVVFIIGLSGCMLAFEEEIKSLIYDYKYTVEINDNSKEKPLSEIFKAACLISKSIPINRIEIINKEDHSYIFKNYTFVPDEEAGFFYWEDTEFYYEVFVNPYTTEIIEAEDQTFGLFRFLVSLHVSLLLNHEIGTRIVGITTLIFVIMLITGLILWWPKNKKALKVRTWFRWKSTTQWRRKNYDLHNIVGFYSMFLVIFIALTGLMWALDWFSHSVEWIANGGKTIEKEKVKVVSTLAPLVSDYPLDIVHNSLRKNHPQAKIYSISLPQDSLGTIGTFVVYNEKIRGVYLQFDQYSGEPLHAEGKWEDKTNGEKVWAYNYDIHTGAIGGIVGKTIAFFVSLFSASLPVTGFLIWYSRNKKKKKLKRTGGSRGAKKVAKGVAVNKLNQTESSTCFEKTGHQKAARIRRIFRKLAVFL